MSTAYKECRKKLIELYNSVCNVNIADELRDLGVRKGLTKKELENILGKPDKRLFIAFFYGDIAIFFENVNGKLYVHKAFERVKDQLTPIKLLGEE